MIRRYSHRMVYVWSSPKKNCLISTKLGRLKGLNGLGMLIPGNNVVLERKVAAAI